MNYSIFSLSSRSQEPRMFTTGDTTSTETPMVYGRLKKYWRKKRYQRLYPSEYDVEEGAMLYTTSKKKKHYMKVAKFGGEKANTGRGGSWKLKVSPKVRLRKLLVTPVLKMLAGIRDAYVNTMLRLAGNVGTMNGNYNNVFGGRRIPKARQVKEKKASRSSKEEFESKLIYEIYKVLAASRQLENMHDGSDAVVA